MQYHSTSLFHLSMRLCNDLYTFLFSMSRRKSLCDGLSLQTSNRPAALWLPRPAIGTDLERRTTGEASLARTTPSNADALTPQPCHHDGVKKSFHFPSPNSPFFTPLFLTQFHTTLPILPTFVPSTAIGTAWSCFDWAPHIPLTKRWMIPREKICWGKTLDKQRKFKNQSLSEFRVLLATLVQDFKMVDLHCNAQSWQERLGVYVRVHIHNLNISHLYTQVMLLPHPRIKWLLR